MEQYFLFFLGRCHFPVFCRANAILFAEQTIKSARYIKATTESYRLNRKFGMAVELPACLFHFQSTHILHGRFSSNGFDGICQCVLIGAKCGDYIIAVNVSIGQVIIGEQILLQSNNQILLFAGRCK